MKAKRAAAFMVFIPVMQPALVASWADDVKTLSSNRRRRKPGPLTSNKDIAPIIFQHCASCRRPGRAWPFNLLTFTDVKKRAEQVAEVVERRYMPPWLPERGVVEFTNDRSLSADQTGVIRLRRKTG